MNIFKSCNSALRALFALATASALVLFLSSHIAVAVNDTSPQLTFFSVKQTTVIDNDKNDLNIKIKFTHDGKAMNGGYLKLKVVDDSKAKYDVLVPLNGPKFKKAQGTAKLTARLVCSDSEWLKITALLVDADGKKSKSKRLKLNSVPNPRESVSYKIDFPLGTEPKTRIMNFTAFDQNGNRVSLWDYYGKIIIVDFSTMWCGPCDWMATDLKKLWKKYEDNENVVFLSVFHDGYKYDVPVTQQDLQTWTGLHGVDWPHLGDPDRVAWKLYRDPEHPTSVPQWMMVDPWGIIHSKSIGYGPNWFYDTVNATIRTYLDRWFSDSSPRQ